jgi:hypothetical protein
MGWKHPPPSPEAKFSTVHSCVFRSAVSAAEKRILESETVIQPWHRRALVSSRLVIGQLLKNHPFVPPPRSQSETNGHPARERC